MHNRQQLDFINQKLSTKNFLVHIMLVEKY